MSALLMLAIVIIWYVVRRRRRRRRPLARMYVKKNVWDAIERWANHTEGVVAVEFALISIPFIFLVGLGIDGMLGAVSKASLTFAVQEAAIASAGGLPNWQDIFAGNVSTPTATITCTGGVCDGASTYSTIFAGILGVSSVPLAAHAVAVKP
jgi:hypothetical protein